MHLATALLVTFVLAQHAPHRQPAAGPSSADQYKGMAAAALARAVSSDPQAARAAMDDLVETFDASIHSDRQQPEQRRVQFDDESLALGIRLGDAYARATRDRTYARRFRARKARIEGTQLLNDRRYAAAIAKLKIALGEAQALDDAWLETITRVNLAYGYLETGQAKQALVHCEAAAALAEGIDDRARALTMFNLASMQVHLGNFERSLDLSRQAAALSRKVGIKLWEGNSLLNAAAAQRQLGDVEGSRATLEQGLAVLEQTSDRLGQGRTLYNLALVSMDQRRYDDAARYMERALPIVRGLDIRHSHEIETAPGAYTNPVENAALQVLIDAYSKLGNEQKAAQYKAELAQLNAKPRGPGPHTHR